MWTEGVSMLNPWLTKHYRNKIKRRQITDYPCIQCAEMKNRTKVTTLVEPGEANITICHDCILDLFKNQTKNSLPGEFLKEKQGQIVGEFQEISEVEFKYFICNDDPKKEGKWSDLEKRLFLVLGDS